MNILIPDNWLREFLKTPATPLQIQSSLSLCGPSIERLHKDKEGYIYDVEVTTNRVDCMSIMGMAREAAAILPEFKIKAELVKPLPLKVKNKTPLSLTIKNNPKLCKRILAIRLEGIKIDSSPEWLQKRLTQVGQRPLNNVIDITNYVMWEMGHPVHAFDYDRLVEKTIIVREAAPKEMLVTLDGKKHILEGGEVVFDDGKGTIIDLPGIMGTQNTVVTDNTKNVLLLIESIVPEKIRSTSMNLNIRSQAAVLNEKGINPDEAMDAMLRAIDLYKKVVDAKEGSELLDIYPDKESVFPINMNQSLLETYLGIKIDSQRVVSILSKLGFQTHYKAGMYSITPPAWRFKDVNIPQDIIEEVARIHGYHNLPSQLMEGRLPTEREDKMFKWEEKIKSILSNWGFTETYTYSFVSREEEANPKALKIKNPLSNDWEYLRTSLAPSQINVISQNKGKVSQLNLFEIANVYTPQENMLPKEELHLVISTTNIDFFYLKGILEGLFKAHMGVDLIPNIVTYNDPGCVISEINLEEAVLNAKTNKRYIPISKFSPIIEDFNIDKRPADKYSQLVSQLKSKSELIQDISLIDIYKNKLTLRFTFNSRDRQLSSKDIEPIRKKLEGLSN
jgi:phenylalanyl-tRNA synthetase beta chain